MRGFDIVGVGHSCLDSLCTVENYPREDDSTHITKIEYQGGGAVATALVAASILGSRVAYIGNTGLDYVSKEIKSLLEKDGVNTDALKEREDSNGLESFVMINSQNGTRTKFPQRDTNPPIDWTEDLNEMVLESKILHLDGTNYINAVEALKRARKGKTVVSLDGCSMQSDNEKNIELASSVDILIMNKKYPLRVSGKSSYEEALREMSGWGPKSVMCTLGEDGVMAVISGRIRHFPAIPAPFVVDTTGCGDVFHGAYLTAYLRGMDEEESIMFASAAASLKCTEKGGRKGVRTREEVLEYMKNNCISSKKGE